MGGLPEIIGFFIVFGVLAALIGILTTGAMRLTSLIVLTALTLIMVGTPDFRARLGNVPILNRIFATNQTPTTQTPTTQTPTTTFPDEPRVNGTPSPGGIPPTTPGGGVPPTGTGVPSGTAPSQTRPSPVPARW
ncbi:MAG: hypothetical protein KME20_24520 [Kaiparowitsia implicata GSE-PSE-MK54-09C]|jgi:hypothetical protein|nr:hypothetical protein [Kaiparowitsia implicata GSE-PSE-MK54-09C]